MLMKEKIARRIHQSLWRLYDLRGDGYEWKRQDEALRLDSLDIADAVLEAMMEPDEHMLAQVNHVPGFDESGLADYQAMITSARKGEG